MGVFVFLVGVIVGSAATLVYMIFNSVGALRIDRSDEVDGPHLFLELRKDIPFLVRKKHVYMEVKDENFDSRK